MKRLFARAAFPAMMLITAVVLFYAMRSADREQEDYREARQARQQVFALDLPDSLSFAGEAVPMDLFWVREAYDRELTTNVFWHSSTFLMLKRASRYFPLIEPILKRNEVPDDFKYLAMAESNLTQAVSPAGAAGFWQFLKETGKIHGLEINDEVDERYNIEKSTEAACRYLLGAKARLGSWTLAAAAYNAGPANVEKPLEQQKGTGFYDVLLNPETSRYLFRILAIKEIHKDPGLYGFQLREKDLYPPIPCTALAIDSSIRDLAAFSRSAGLNYKILKEFNPWLRKNSLSQRAGKTYTILLPDPGSLYYSKLQSGGKTE